MGLCGAAAGSARARAYDRVRLSRARSRVPRSGSVRARCESRATLLRIRAGGHHRAWDVARMAAQRRLNALSTHLLEPVPAADAGDDLLAIHGGTVSSSSLTNSIVLRSWRGVAQSIVCAWLGSCVPEQRACLIVHRRLQPAVGKVGEGLFKWPIITEEDEEAVLTTLRNENLSGTNITREFEVSSACHTPLGSATRPRIHTHLA